ncbi:tyrosine-protein phosphatase [Ureibacillus sp. GCM10028918]|uniref:tyrosine-protein phosphatase n=1 Tax=Ureibacillus sp. GCM10028918 TaxID=3273429 RepID=UPI003623C2C4
MKNAKLNWVRLPLKGAENCRELGGYNSRYGEQTNWHAFLRSNDMSKLTQEDILFLKDYGVKTVIDLRGEDELQTHKNLLANENFCEYHNIPFIAGQVTNMNFSYEKIFMGDFYVQLLEKNDAVKRIFDCIAQAEEGCIIFHCAAGKDRTGILAMLLLGLAGVEKKDILSNYEVTYTNLESIQELAVQNNDAKYKDIPKEFMFSRSEYIQSALDHILNNYGSVEQYLVSNGIEQDVIERVKGRLLLVADVTIA